MSMSLGVYATFQRYAYLSEKDSLHHKAISNMFKLYLWGENGKGGLSTKLKSLQGNNYGSDVELILFQFVVGATIIQPESYKDIENFRPKEKSIAVWIAIDDSCYFDLSDGKRRQYIRESILNRMESLKIRFKARKFDVDMDRLIRDLSEIL